MTTAAAIETWNIPAELKALRRWVVWRGVWKITKEGKRKLDKPPYQVNGDPASHTDPSTWTTFEKAAACAEEHGLTGTKGGIGFVFTDDDPYVGVDLDGCVVNGECLPEAITIIKRLGGYAELSVSGTGWHILLRARKPSKRCTVARKWNGKFKGKIEVFEKERFFTFTGSIHELSQDPIPERQEAFTAWYREVFPESGNGAKASGTGSTALLTDDEVLV